MTAASTAATGRTAEVRRGQHFGVSESQEQHKASASIEGWTDIASLELCVYWHYEQE